MIVAMLPVSPHAPPLSSSELSRGSGGDTDSVAAAQEEIEEDVDMKLALPSDPIVGVDVIHGQHGPGAISPKPLSTPSSMTAAQWAIHKISHLPYHPGCPICAATRRPNSMHLSTHEHLRVAPYWL